MAAVSTSRVQRQNPSMRTHMRRFTRLASAFSKTVESHADMVALCTALHNFRIPGSLRAPPAMEAGPADHLWDIEKVVAVMDQRAPKPARPKTHTTPKPQIPK